jgi:superfamily II DNA or RNA helicase
MILLFKQKDANWIGTTSSMGEAVAKVALTYKKKVKLVGMEHAEWKHYDMYDGRRKAFPVGLLPRIREKALALRHQVLFHSMPFPTLPVALDYKLPGITYEPYQESSLQALRLYKRGIIVASTGAGKSIIAGGIIKRFSIPKTLVITVNKIIFNQFIESFEEWFPGKVGAIGDDENRPGHITLCTFQSLSKVNIKDFQMVILDEAQRINDTIIWWLNQYGKKIFYRFGVTATPQKEEDNFEKAADMHGFFGSIIKQISDEETISRVVPVNVYMVKFINTRPTEKSYAACLRHDILFNEERSFLLLSAAKKLLLDKGLSCLVLLDEIKQAEIMFNLAKLMGLDPHLAHSKNQGGMNERIKKELNSGKIRLVIATQVFGIGTNIPNVDGVVLASSRKSEIDTLQKIGRGRRRTKSKDHLLLIDSIDQIKGAKKVYRHFYKYSLERMKIYEDKGWAINRMLTV